MKIAESVYLLYRAPYVDRASAWPSPEGHVYTHIRMSIWGRILRAREGALRDLVNKFFAGLLLSGENSVYPIYDCSEQKKCAHGIRVYLG